MSYKVLARKWRPQRFEDMLGQEPVLRALVNALDSDRLHHAYLFTGMRGVGKTTIARIFAKCLNCLERGVSSTPCGTCSICRDVEAGRFIDLIEVDAASRTKVEETRELLENVAYAPAAGRYKVYLIDEVHMFSASSFNALLKTLEEPPAHVKFLLATTDPQKVPVTVLSRCLQFNLRRMAPSALADYLASVLEQESVPAERPALDLIARASEGSVRDALSLVEQATAFGEGRVLASEVESMLGRVSSARLLGLLEALGNGDVQTLFARVEELAVYAPDFTEMLGEILSLLHRIALQQSVPGSSDASQPDHDTVSALAERLAPEDVQLWYQIVQHARRDLPYSPDEREGFDMTLLRLHAFRPQQSHALSGSADAAPVAKLAPVAAALMPTAQVEPVAAPAPGPDSAPAPVVAPAAVSPAATAAAGAAQAVPRPVPKPVPKPAASGSLEALVPDAWAGIVEQLVLSGMPRQLATHSAIEGRDGGRLQLVLDAAQEHLAGPRFIDRLASALSAWSGAAVTVDVRLATDAQVQTPARAQQLSEEQAVAGARRSLAEDERLQRLLNDVEGTVDEDSVRPIDRPSE